MTEQDLEQLKELTKVKLKNLDKCFYPDAGVTKAQVIEYYIKMAPQILPVIKDRPLCEQKQPQTPQQSTVSQESLTKKLKYTNKPTQNWITTSDRSNINEKKNTHLNLRFSSFATFVSWVDAC